MRVPAPASDIARLEAQNDLLQRPFRHVMDALGVAVVGDVAFARPELYEHLEAEGYRYAIRLPGNDVLERAIEPLLTRPVGRPPNRPVGFYDSFPYQAASWRKPRRVVAKVALPGRSARINSKRLLVGWFTPQYRP